jgi:hypothetical protein
MDLNDTIDDEDALCIPSLDNIQPYQFEPMACRSEQNIVILFNRKHEACPEKDFL